MFWRKKKQGPVITETAPIYRFFGTMQPSAGAMRFAFVSRQTLPVRFLEGNGRQMGWAVQNTLRVLQSPQVWQQHGVTMAGYGGLVAGQVVTQPLISQG